MALPIPVTGELAARLPPRHAYDLRLRNDTQSAAPLRITAELDPPGGSITVRPDAVMLEPGMATTVSVRAKPTKPLIGTPKPFAVEVKVRDAYDAERPPYLTEVAAGTRKPRVPSLVAGIAAVLLALGATAAIALSDVRIPLPGRRQADKTPTNAPTPVTVSRPYALIDVFPHRGADGGKADADAALGRLTGAGMPVRLVDSLSSDVLADRGSGFWVLLQDGFASAAEAETYCTRWRPVAPKCAVTT